MWSYRLLHVPATTMVFGFLTMWLCGNLDQLKTNHDKETPKTKKERQIK